ncbi:FAD-dependent oxidoreductase [Cellulosimicrobium sp. CUA-896]|uniref:FAD-dependent oxidoreductase n=1 Tax=Cellulosimicrobium sp. CUA-896 TaxID=1517881 RepID=UPI00351596F7
MRRSRGATWSSRRAAGRSSSACRAPRSTPSRSTRSPTRRAPPARPGAAGRGVPRRRGHGRARRRRGRRRPTGVEVAGALAELMAALAGTGTIPHAGRVTVVDRGGALLGAFSEASHEYAHERLTRQGAVLRLRTGVAAVREHGVDLVDGTTLPTRTVVWGGGESAAPVVRSSGVGTGRGGRWRSDPTSPCPATPRCTRSATPPRSRRRVRARCRSSGRSPSSRAAGPRTTSCGSCTATRRPRSGTRTRGSWR